MGSSGVARLMPTGLGSLPLLRRSPEPARRTPTGRKRSLLSPRSSENGRLMPTDLGSLLLIAWTSGSARLTTTDGFRMREMIQGDQLDMGPRVLTLQNRKSMQDSCPQTQCPLRSQHRGGGTRAQGGTPGKARECQDKGLGHDADAKEGEGKEGNARERRGMARGEDKGYEVEGEGELDNLLDREERGKCTESYPEPPHVNPTPNPQDCFQQPYHT